MQVPLQPGLTARAKPRLVLFDDQHPAPQLCGGSDAWCWTGDEIAAVAIHRPDSRDIAAVAEQAYREAWQQLSANGHAHWLRTWTYFDDILQGEGDAERYRQFCLGRARGLPRDAGFPAATVIGSASPGFWLWVIAARSPGQRFENPRQTPAWQYPAAQLDEPLANIDALVTQVERDLGRVLKAGSLRLYVRDPAHVTLLAQCRARWPGAEWSAHQGTICRADLAVEIEGVFVAEPEPREN